MTQIGYLVKTDAETEVPAEWDFEFENKLGKYYSNRMTRKLDEKYGDLYGEI